MKLIRRWYVILFPVLVACSGNEPSVPKTLVSSSSYLRFDADLLKQFISASGLNLSADVIKYDAEVYKVTYTTTYDDRSVTASGLVVLPQTTDAVDMVSFQHGTITGANEAPTTLPASDQTAFFYGALAGAGFVTVVPDYIGFGASADVVPPYYVAKATADAVLDNLKAARDLASSNGVDFNGKVFLAGYSQGGYATMAAHKAIEENGLPGFTLIASFPASGGYDVKKMQEYLFAQEDYDEPNYIAYVAYAYQTYYHWTQPLSDFFQSPYDTRIPGLFDGSKTGDEINASLTTHIPDLIQPDLLANIDSDPSYAYIVDAFNENSLTGWVPHTTMIMYHGDADTTVPYQNSVDTYNAFIAAGASTDVVQLITLQGKTHFTGVEPYIEDFVPKLLDMK